MVLTSILQRTSPRLRTLASFQDCSICGQYLVRQLSELQLSVAFSLVEHLKQRHRRQPSVSRPCRNGFENEYYISTLAVQTRHNLCDALSSAI